FAIGLNGDALGYEIFAKHVFEGGAFDVFGVASLRNDRGIKLRLTAQLFDTLGDAVRVALLVIRMLEKFGSGSVFMDASCHVVMKAISQNAYDLGRKSLVKDLDDLLFIKAVILCDGARFDLGPRAIANGFDVCQKTHLSLPRNLIRSFTSSL